MIVFLELRLGAKRLNECSQCGRRLPSTGKIEIVAREGRAPLFQRPRETPGLNISRHLVIVDIREPLAGQDCLTDQVGVIEYQRPVDPNPEPIA